MVWQFLRPQVRSANEFRHLLPKSFHWDHVFTVCRFPSFSTHAIGLLPKLGPKKENVLADTHLSSNIWAAQSLNASSSTSNTPSSSSSNQQSPPGAEESPDPSGSVSPGLTCPTANYTLYQTGNSGGETFLIFCYYDTSAASTSQQTTGFSECLDLCANTTGCVAASFVPQGSSGVCYVKNAILPGQANQGVWHARWSNTTYLPPPPPQPANPYATAKVTQPVPPSAFTSLPYALIEDFEPSTFFDKFQFGTDADATLGTVEYVNKEVAEKYDMFSVYDDHVTWNVDTRTVLVPGGPNRKSIRLLSNNNYTHGNFPVNQSTRQR